MSESKYRALLGEALELMKATYPYSPPCHDWEEQVKAHKAASSALAKYKGEL